MALTKKQTELIQVIAAGNEDGTHADLDQVIERLSYSPSKQSIQFSIRALVVKELITKDGREKRRGRMRALIAPTIMGRHFAGPRSAAAIISTDLDEEILKLI